VLLFPATPLIATVEIVNPELIVNVVATLFVPLILIAVLIVKFPAPEIVEVWAFKLAVFKFAAVVVGAIESVFAAAITIFPVIVNASVPDIVEVPVLAVVIDENERGTSILSVPPALIVTGVDAVIVLASTVVPVKIVVCPHPHKLPRVKQTINKDFSLGMHFDCIFKEDE
jgi:hypothetical protein